MKEFAANLFEGGKHFLFICLLICAGGTFCWGACEHPWWVWPALAVALFYSTGKEHRRIKRGEMP